jgi:hypothetical protein
MWGHLGLLLKRYLGKGRAALLETVAHDKVAVGLLCQLPTPIGHCQAVVSHHQCVHDDARWQLDLEQALTAIQKLPTHATAMNIANSMVQQTSLNKGRVETNFSAASRLPISKVHKSDGKGWLGVAKATKPMSKRPIYLQNPRRRRMLVRCTGFAPILSLRCSVQSCRKVDKQAR